ncbi:MAG: dodecin family protein [Bacteroidota bacterium]|nr:dodecin family protein [Bacteroidota bacterium]
MSVIKVIEIMASSEKSWEDAAQRAIDEAGKTLDHIRSIYVQDHSALIKNNKIAEYRITGKISFEIENSDKKRSKK